MNFETLEEISTNLSLGRYSSEELCRVTLEGIKTTNPVIGAYSDVLDETAIAESVASDKRRIVGRLRGKLDGVPIAVKDLVDTSPAVCRAGLDVSATYRPPGDANVVQSLRNAGAVIIGVTETDRGAFGTTTLQVVNPTASTQIVGGSSGGSGAAVAAGLAFGAIGTDTGGSIRIPSACCSISGFKPTWGRVDQSGVRPLAHAYDHVGPMARNVRGLQALQTVIDPALTQEPANAAKLTIGIDEQYYRDANDHMHNMMSHVIDTLEKAGHKMRTVSLPQPDDVLEFHMVNVCKDAADYHTERYADVWTRYPEIARDAIKFGLQIDHDNYSAAQQKRAVARRQLDEIFEDVDIIVSPTLPVDAPNREAETVDVGGIPRGILETTVRYTALFNQTGHPVVSLPAHVGGQGTAASMQLVGPANRDGRLLAIAQNIEDTLDVQIDYQSLVERVALPNIDPD